MTYEKIVLIHRLQSNIYPITKLNSLTFFVIDTYIFWFISGKFI